VQPGQCSQPSPDAVSRTVAPLATISQSMNADANASRRNVAGASSIFRTRATMDESICTRRV
jgi:hypothetical protein